jgi:inorganic pyrophosphatase
MKTVVIIFNLIVVPMVLSNPIDEIPFIQDESLFNFFVEIPSGSKEKWEINKENGLLELEQREGKDRIINFLSYPGNYGFIPQTLSGDGDPIDLIDLDESFPKGGIKQVKIIGAIYFEDNKEIDYKFIGVSPNGSFKKVNSIEELLLEKPALLEILKLWFLSYKQPGKMEFIRFIQKEESIKILNKSHLRWSEKQKGE